MKKFYVGIQGKDNSNNTVQRIDPRVIDPILFRIEVSPIDGAKIYINDTMHVNIMIISYMRTVIKVSVNDSRGLVLQNKPKLSGSGSVNANENTTGTFDLEAGTIEESTTVSIMITYRVGRNWVDGPVVRRTYRVVTNDTSLTPDSENTDSSKESSSSSTIAIAGGVSGALLLLIAIIVAVIVYKKLTAKRNMVSQDHLGVMPKNTKFTTES